jgi:hypothetical protein
VHSGDLGGRLKGVRRGPALQRVCSGGLRAGPAAVEHMTADALAVACRPRGLLAAKLGLQLGVQVLDRAVRRVGRLALQDVIGERERPLIGLGINTRGVLHALELAGRVDHIGHRLRAAIAVLEPVHGDMADSDHAERAFAPGLNDHHLGQGVTVAHRWRVGA